MRELLLGSWSPQITASIKQNPLQLRTAGLLASGIAITLTFGVRGAGAGDGGGCSFDDSDSGSCGGD
jgi:hypothetical protein